MEGPVLAWNTSPDPHLQHMNSTGSTGSVPFPENQRMNGQLQLLRKKIRVRHPCAKTSEMASLTGGGLNAGAAASRSSSAPASREQPPMSPLGQSPAHSSPGSAPHGLAHGRGRSGAVGEERIQPRRVVSSDAGIRRPCGQAGGATLSPMAVSEPVPRGAPPARTRPAARNASNSRGPSMEVIDPGSTAPGSNGSTQREGSARPPRPARNGRPPSGGGKPTPTSTQHPPALPPGGDEGEGETAPSPTQYPPGKGKGRGRGRGGLRVAPPAAPSKEALLPEQVACGGVSLPRGLLDRIATFVPVATWPSFRRVAVCFHTVVAQQVRRSESVSEALETTLEYKRLNSKRVWVVVRARPSDKLGGLHLDRNRAVVPGQDKTSGFTFFSDRAFGGDATQEDVGGWICDRLLPHALNGEHLCLMAYGQTGSGKTHTMFGTLEAGDNAGLAFRAVNTLAQLLRSGATSCKSVDFSFMECYNDNLYDLLDGSKPLSKQRSSDQHVVPQGLTRRQTCADTMETQVHSWLREGAATRTVGKTVFNPRSSRSHGIVLLTLVWGSQQRNTRLIESKRGSVRTGETRIYIVDLAGSERAGLYAVDAEQLREGEQINLSLSALGRVVGALAGGKCKHVPYRDSALTWLLKDAITGTSARVCLVAAVSPAHPVETVSTLRYAKQYSALQTTSGTRVPDLTAEVRQLQRKLDNLKQNLKGAMEGDEHGVGWTKESLSGTVQPTRAARELMEAHPYLAWTKAHQSKWAVRGQRRDRSGIGRTRTTLDLPEPRNPSDPPDGRLVPEAQRSAEANLDPDGPQPDRVCEVVFEGKHGRPATILWYPVTALEEVLPPKSLLDLMAAMEQVEAEVAKKKADLKAAQDFCKNEQKEWMSKT